MRIEAAQYLHEISGQFRSPVSLDRGGNRKRAVLIAVPSWGERKEVHNLHGVIAPSQCYRSGLPKAHCLTPRTTV
jgi:hypothetical protein